VILPGIQLKGDISFAPPPQKKGGNAFWVSKNKYRITANFQDTIRTLFFFFL
jgi:hypothetical protein